jgi:SAM-dependent methyltransferase
MAVPLTQYLDPERGSYDGVDPVMDGILWCAQTITPAYPRFRFQRLDIAHPLYNPQGSLPGNEVRFGFPNQSFDFITMTSVATHLPPEELVVYLNEAARLLAPGGRLFLTAFALDGQSTGQERLKFRRWGDGSRLVRDRGGAAGRGRDRRRLPAGARHPGRACGRAARPRPLARAQRGALPGPADRGEAGRSSS